MMELTYCRDGVIGMGDAHDKSKGEIMVMALNDKVRRV